jgi:hypothetical protein
MGVCADAPQRPRVMPRPRINANAGGRPWTSGRTFSSKNVRYDIPASYTVVEGRYWSVVEKSFGEISTISPSGSIDVLVIVSAEETSPSKIRLPRRLLFAPIPRICLEGEIVVRELRSLQELWLTMPLEVRSVREIAVEKFSGLSLEEVRRATMLHLEHSAYNDLRSTDATTSEEQ